MVLDLSGGHLSGPRSSFGVPGKGMLDTLGIQDIVLLADREFADTTLMSWLKGVGWNYRNS